MDSVFVFSSDSDPQGRSAQIAMPTVFQVVMRDIGKSFQLAITTSRLNLIDYGNATAQSYLLSENFQTKFNTIISCMRCIKPT